MYCLKILYTRIYSRDKKEMKKIFKDAEKQGFEDIHNLDTLVSQRTKNIIFQQVHDNDHFIHDFIEKCPLGRYRHMRYRTYWAKIVFETSVYNLKQHFVISQLPFSIPRAKLMQT